MQLVQNDPAMEQAWGVIKHLSADEQERAEAEAVEKARRDMVARLRSAEILGHTKGLAEGKKAGLAEGKKVGIAEGKKAGLAEGKKAGLAEGQLGIVSYMLRQGRTVDEISSLIGLPLDAVSLLVAKVKSLQ